MGRKRGRGRKYFLLHVTCVISLILGVAGCIPPQEYRAIKAPTPLARANDLIANGDFKGALKQNDKVLMQASSAFGDQALFQRGLIYSHPQNPGQDQQKSIETFKKILNEYPDSTLVETAEVWIQSLSKNVSMEREVVNAYGKIGLLQLTIEEQRHTIDQFRGELRTHRVQIKKLKTEIVKLKSQIEKLKKIDLRIEEKKRSVTPQ